MTPARAKELLPVITAFANGEEVQRSHTKWTSGEWISDDEHDFECADYSYRIKPKPVTRPWKPEEVPLGSCVHFHSGRCRGGRGLITAVGTAEVRVGESRYTFVELYEMATMADGSPCGVTE